MPAPTEPTPSPAAPLPARSEITPLIRTTPLPSGKRTQAPHTSTVSTPWAVGIAAACLVIGVLGAFVVLGGHGFGGSQPADDADAAAPAEELDESTADETDSATAEDDDASDDAQEENVLEVTVRDKLEDYSWEELSHISLNMQETGSRSAALELAKSYHLIDSASKFNSTKTFSLLDGTRIEVRLVDIMHDTVQPGGQPTGLTFITTGIIGHHRMAPETTTTGGWESSDMRSWMRGTFYGQLPNELTDVIVPVGKLSNNVGKATQLSAVTETADYLWIPSIVEICGPVNWEYSSNPANSGFYNSVFNAEGSQYAYFSQQRIQSEKENACLALGENWWMRSSAASTGRGRYVDASGNPSGFGDSNQELGVVFGFCL